MISLIEKQQQQKKNAFYLPLRDVIIKISLKAFQLPIGRHNRNFPGEAIPVSHGTY